MVFIEPADLTAEHRGEGRKVFGCRNDTGTLPPRDRELIEIEPSGQLPLRPPSPGSGFSNVLGENTPNVFSHLTSHHEGTILQIR